MVLEVLSGGGMMMKRPFRVPDGTRWKTWTRGILSEVGYRGLITRMIDSIEYKVDSVPCRSRVNSLYFFLAAIRVTTSGCEL